MSILAASSASVIGAKTDIGDIEGHLVDQKTYSFEHDERGTVHSGQPIHEMWLRLTIDADFLVHDSEAVTDFGPYRICGDITPNFAKLKGIKIGPGWRRKVHDIVGGVKGCTHLVELLSPMATTAYQTLWSIIRKRGGQRFGRSADGPEHLSRLRRRQQDCSTILAQLLHRQLIHSMAPRSGHKSGCTGLVDRAYAPSREPAGSVPNGPPAAIALRNLDPRPV